MKKVVPFDSALGTVKDLSRLVRTQACFVLGFPGEEDRDRRETKAYVKKLAKAGLDETAFFVVRPFSVRSFLDDETTWGRSPGGSQFRARGRGRGPRSPTLATPPLRHLSFDEVLRFPFRVIAQSLRLLFRKFDTKMGNGPGPGAVLVLVALAITRRGGGPW